MRVTGFEKGRRRMTDREMQAHAATGVETNDGRLAQYEVKASQGKGYASWPTGFAGVGWAVKDENGDVTSRHAFRYDALKAAGFEVPA